MPRCVIVLSLCVFLVVGVKPVTAGLDERNSPPPVVDVSRMIGGFYLWDSLSSSEPFNDLIREWHLEGLIPKRGHRIGPVERHQEIWLNMSREDEHVREKLKDAITLIVRPFLFHSKREALAAANLIKEAPFVGNLAPGSFSGRPIGDIVWTSKKPNSSPDYSRPLEALFVKNKTVVHLMVTRPPVTEWKSPVNSAWVENLARHVVEKI